MLNIIKIREKFTGCKMSLEPNWVNNLQEPYRNNRYEVYFKDIEDEGIQDVLRLSCHSVQKIAENTVKFSFYDFEGNKEYNAIKFLLDQNTGSPNRVSVVCYDTRHGIYETLNITGVCSTEPVLDFSWNSGKSTRSLVLYMKDAVIKSER